MAKNKNVKGGFLHTLVVNLIFVYVIIVVPVCLALLFTDRVKNLVPVILLLVGMFLFLLLPVLTEEKE